MESSPAGNDSESKGYDRPLASKESRGLVVLICVILAAITWIVFGQTTHFRFINYDDHLVVFENPMVVNGITWKGLAWAFANDQLGHWVPLTTISHMVDCQIYGVQPGGHHLTNVLLHTAVAILLFLALQRLTGSLWSSAAVAAIFAVHPLRAESVAWVTERKDVLSGVFFMLTLLAYEHYTRRPYSRARYLVVAFVFALGLLSKSMLVTVPFVLLLLDWWPLGRIPSGRPSRLILEKLPLLALSVIASAVQIWTAVENGEIIVPGEQLPLALRVGNALVAFYAYVEKLVYPANLTVLYPHPRENIEVWTVAIALLGLVGVSVGVYSKWRTMPWLAVGWLWYFGMLMPVIGFIQNGEQSMADRYTYLPQIGVLIAGVWTFDRVCRSWPALRPVVGGAAAITVAGLIFLGSKQTAYWRDSETLWTHALACGPESGTAHHGLGHALAERGATDEAIAHYRRGIELWPYNAGTHNNLGLLLIDRGEIGEGTYHLTRAVELRPREVMFRRSLAETLAAHRPQDEAVSRSEKALALDPNSAAAHYDLGSALNRCGRTDEAVVHFQKAVESRPDFAEAHENLALALSRLGRANEAIVHLQKAMEIKGASASGGADRKAVPPAQP